MTSTRTFAIVSLMTSIAAAITVVGATLVPQRTTGVDRVTVPLVVEGNRPFIELTFRKPDGTIRKARFLLDTGGGGFLIAEPLARDLGLQWGATTREEGAEFASPTAPPTVSVGDFALDLTPERTFIKIGKGNILPASAPGSAEGMVPGHLLAKYHVVFDYPAATFTIARAGVLTPRGNALPMPVSKRQGFPRTEVEIEGKAYGLLLDTGASFTMVSEVLLKALGDAHATWPRYAGAHGEASMLGGQTLETLFVPAARWGTHDLPEFGVVSQRAGTFERYMSGMMTAPIVGSLAGNVLKRFRVELDYANERLYLSTP